MPPLLPASPTPPLRRCADSHAHGRHKRLVEGAHVGEVGEADALVFGVYERHLVRPEHHRVEAVHPPPRHASVVPRVRPRRDQEGEHRQRRPEGVLDGTLEGAECEVVDGRHRGGGAPSTWLGAAGGESDRVVREEGLVVVEDRLIGVARDQSVVESRRGRVRDHVLLHPSVKERCRGGGANEDVGTNALQHESLQRRFKKTPPLGQVA
eukprot:69777-Prorocentrum_minimum.AAC.1